MEKFTKNHFVMFGFILAGLAFSGYLAGVKLFADTCAFGAACPYFLGYPACYTGFIVYALLTIVAIVALIKKELTHIMLTIVTGVSLFGVLFSGRLTFQEMSVWFEQGFTAFVKSLPLCSIGLIFYAAIFILALVIGKNMNEIDAEKIEVPSEPIVAKPVEASISTTAETPSGVVNETQVEVSSDANPEIK